MDERATTVRYWIVGVTTVAAALLYLDRFCVSFALSSIQHDFGLTGTQKNQFLSAFFWSYALFQVPAGWLGQRLGIRVALTLYVLLWSVFTALIGVSSSFGMLIVFRLVIGLAQAGAYPSASRAVRDWLPFAQRGTGSAIVAFGGRAGGFLAPLLTGALMFAFAARGDDPGFRAHEILDPDVVADELGAPPPKSAAELWLAQTLEAQWEHDHSLERREAVHKPDVAEDVTQPSLNDDARRRAAELAASRLNAIPLGTLLVAHGAALPPAVERMATEQHRLWQTSGTGHQRQVARLNRLLWEAGLPGTVKKLESRGWRPAIITIGLSGVGVAMAFFLLFRNDPAAHSACNTAELAHIQAVPATIAGSAAEYDDEPFPWRAFLLDVSLWGNSVSQFATNVGWVFLVLWLPTYLEDVHHVPVLQRSFMAGAPLAAGMIGMLLGGPWTDWWTARYGRTQGRRGPIMASRVLAVAGYLVCLAVTFGPRDSSLSAWITVGGASLVAIATDLSVPAVWAYAQDVGGRHTAAVLGWPNMWGNLGVAAAPTIIAWCIGAEMKSIADWRALFGVCIVAFIVSGASAALMDAGRPLGR